MEADLRLKAGQPPPAARQKMTPIFLGRKKLSREFLLRRNSATFKRYDK